MNNIFNNNIIIKHSKSKSKLTKNLLNFLKPQYKLNSLSNDQ